MNKDNENTTESREAAGQHWPEVAYDATTNFSILGWIWQKLARLKGPKRNIDFSLEE